MSGPWGHLGQAVADVFDIAAPRTTEELEALVNRLFTSQNFRCVRSALSACPLACLSVSVDSRGGARCAGLWDCRFEATPQSV